MKLPCNMLQNLPYFWNMKIENPCSFFRFSFHATLIFSLMNALVYVDTGTFRRAQTLKLGGVCMLLVSR